DNKRLDLVVDLYIVIVRQADAAFEAVLYLVDVILEPLERRNVAFPDNNAVPQQPCLRLPANDAVDDAAAGDGPDLGYLKDLLDNSLAENVLLFDGVEHADHGRLDLFLD